jgi:hypothetical protein
MLQKSWTTLLLYICYRNLGRLCYYIYVTEVLDVYNNRVVQDFCSIYIITESSKISVTSIHQSHDSVVIYMLQKSWTTLIYGCYRNLGQLCYYIYVTEILDNSVIIYMLQKSWTTLLLYICYIQDFCNIYIITESSNISVTYI